jgi:hypothetical protein
MQGLEVLEHVDIRNGSVYKRSGVEKYMKLLQSICAGVCGYCEQDRRRGQRVEDQPAEGPCLAKDAHQVTNVLFRKQPFPRRAKLKVRR